MKKALIGFLRPLSAIVAPLSLAAYPAFAATPHRDPAPPEFHPKREGGVPLRPRKHDRVVHYRKVRPAAGGAATADWPHFLGPTHDGVSSETNLLRDLERADSLLVWALAKGESYSAPSIKGERLVYFHRMGGNELVECLNAETGELYWERKYPTTYRDRFNYLDGPRATPAIDADRVYTQGAQGALRCMDLATGHIYWRRRLADEFGLDQGFFGFSCSPLIEGERLIVNLGQGKCVAAFDKHSGMLKWVAGDPWGRSYATPLAATVHGKRIVFVFAGGMTKPPVGGLLGIDPGSGRIHFRFPWRSKRYFSANASSPVVSGNRVFVSSSYDINGVMLDIQPDLTCRIAYKTRAYASHWTTPILHKGYLYGFENSKLTCMEWATGKQMWQHVPKLGDEEDKSRWDSGRGGDRYREPPGNTGFGFGSLILADGLFLGLGETGLIAWFDLTPKGFRILSGRRLFNAPQTWTAPVLSRGLLYLTQNRPDGRTPPRLLCCDLRAERRGK